jgi:copper chaperone
MKTTYRVEGMTCGHCAASVTKAIKALDPTAKVEVDLENKTVTVEGGVDQTAVGRAVEDAGFQVEGDGS